MDDFDRTADAVRRAFTDRPGYDFDPARIDALGRHYHYAPGHDFDAIYRHPGAFGDCAEIDCRTWQSQRIADFEQEAREWFETLPETKPAYGDPPGLDAFALASRRVARRRKLLLAGLVLAGVVIGWRALDRYRFDVHVELLSPRMFRQAGIGIGRGR